MEIRQLRYFRAVVEHGTFSAAADALHLTQPSLSMAVRQLEQNVGATLLFRGPKGVRTTTAGEAVLRLARTIDEQIDHTTSEVDALVHGKSGRVRMAVTTEYVWDGLGDVLRRCWEEAPDLEVSISHPAPRETITTLYNGIVDFALILSSDPIDLEVRHADSVATWRLAELELMAAVATKDFPDHETISPADMSGLHWLVPVADSWFRALPEVLSRSWAEFPETRPAKITEVSTLQAALPLIADGIGVTLVPDTTNHLPSPGVRLIPLEPEAAPLTVLAVWDATKPLSGPAERVIGVIRKLFPHGRGGTGDEVYEG